MQTLILYPLITTVLYYLGSRALITRFLWSRYPAWLDYYTMCSACSGFAYGVLAAVLIGWRLDLPFVGIDGQSFDAVFLAGLCSSVWTPLLARKHIEALELLNPSDPDQTDPAAPAPFTNPLPPKE